MDNSETACHDAESNALPAVPEHGSLYYHSYSRMSEPPSGLPQLNESTLQRIASNLPSDKWKPLGRVLGLPNRDLDNIATNHYIDPVEQSYQMLLLWVSQKEDATWDKLVDALCTEEVGCSHLARKLCISESKQGVCACTHLCCFRCALCALHVATSVCVVIPHFHGRLHFGC